MPVRRTKPTEVDWPLGGLDAAHAFEHQPRGTTVDCLNVEARDPLTGRERIAQRPGSSKYVSTQFAANIFQHVGQLVYADTTAPSQTTMYSRATKNIGVCGGTIRTFTTSAVATPTGGASALTANAPIICGAQHRLKYYFAPWSGDYKVYTLSTDTVATWTPTAGTLPASGTNKARLICQWQDRIVLAGVAGDPHQWFMSKIGDPLDWDYAPSTTTELQAISGSQDPGESPDVITALIPYRDDVLLMGCDNSLVAITGNPQAGGRLDTFSTGIGMAWDAWAKSPDETLYFFGSRGNVYRLRKGSDVPEDISSPKLGTKLESVNWNSQVVRLAWDERRRGLYVFITSLTAGTDTHYYFDARREAWFPFQYATNTFNPRAVCCLEDDDPANRVVVFGGRSGYLRKIDSAADDDDDAAINSYCFFGPFVSKNGGQLQLDELSIILSDNSDSSTLTVHRGESAEQAFSASAIATGTIVAGRSNPRRKITSAKAFYIKIANPTDDAQWALESMKLATHVLDGAQGRRY